MNGRMTKKVKKIMNKKLRYDLNSLLSVIAKEKFRYRLLVALKIIFKRTSIRIKIRTQVKQSS